MSAALFSARTLGGLNHIHGRATPIYQWLPSLNFNPKQSPEGPGHFLTAYWTPPRKDILSVIQPVPCIHGSHIHRFSQPQNLRILRAYCSLPFYTILQKRLERIWILVSLGVLEPIPHGYQRMTLQNWRYHFSPSFTSHFMKWHHNLRCLVQKPGFISDSSFLIHTSKSPNSIYPILLQLSNLFTSFYLQGS